jgi:hypothetical protein
MKFRWRSWVIEVNYNRWVWGGFFILLAGMFVCFFLASFMFWDWPWDHFFDFGIVFIVVWGAYNFWPKQVEPHTAEEQTSK